MTARRHRRLVGETLEWAIQRWVRTGRSLGPDQASWLFGPTGARTIGAGYYTALAEQGGLEGSVTPPGAGLVADWDALRGPNFDPALVAPSVRRFYERTVEYSLDAWSEWSGPLRPFA